MRNYLLLKWNHNSNSYTEILNSFDYYNVLEIYDLLKNRNKDELYLIVQIIRMVGDIE